MSIFLALVGFGLILIIVWDSLETVVLPRRVTNPNRLTALFYRLTWAPWAAVGQRIRSERQRENFLWLFGPLSVLMLLGVWALGLIVGFALLRNLAEGRSIWHSMYISATTFFTVGLGDAVPTSVLDGILAVVEGGSGFSFLALV